MVFSENSYYRDIYWENTNKLLNENGFTGLKTGVTNTAGPCLSCCYQKDNLNLIIVSLASCTMEARWYKINKKKLIFRTFFLFKKRDEMKIIINWVEEEMK